MLPSTVAVPEYTDEMVAIGEMVADPKPAKHDAKYRELFCNLFLQFTSESTDKDESLIVKKVKEKVDKQFRKDKNSWRMRGVRRAQQAENKRSSVRTNGFAAMRRMRPCTAKAILPVLTFSCNQKWSALVK